MKLSIAERQILINQFLLLKKLDKENNTSFYDAKEYDNYITILHAGYEGLYDEILIDKSYSISKDVSDEVYKILYMYDRALLSYEKLSDEEKDEISKDKITLYGFDGQNEHDHFAIYRFLVKNMNKFSYTLKTKDLDSHSPTLSNYRKKLELFDEYKVSGDILELDGLKQVFY